MGPNSHESINRVYKAETIPPNGQVSARPYAREIGRLAKILLTMRYFHPMPGA